MKLVQWKFYLWFILSISILVGCGKQIPAIDPVLLQNKSSILMITGTDLPNSVNSTLDSTLLQWRDQKLVSSEWWPNTSSLSEEQLSNIKNHSYDYIVVAGHTLVQNILPIAEEITQSRWLLLDDGLARRPVKLTASHIMLKAVQEDKLYQEWDEWVRQQLVSGRSIEWVTTSSLPVPADWAPSEEAEYVSLADAEGWFSPFQNQIHQHAPSWIVIYAPLEAVQIQRIKNMSSIPVVNIASTSLELQWGGILNSIQELLDKKSWTSGVQPYKDTELKIVKNL